jgi:hypothetical protein
MRYFTILRLLRLVRLLAQVERFAFICTCIWKMMMASKEAIGLLFGILYVYATMGVMLFGGLIYDGNEGELSDPNTTPTSCSSTTPTSRRVLLVVLLAIPQVLDRKPLIRVSIQPPFPHSAVA